MNIIAIDQSLRQTGIYVESTGNTYVIKTKGLSEGEALNKLYYRLKTGIEKNSPCIIVYEGNSCFGSLGYGASTLFAAIGIIKLIAAQTKNIIYEMPVNTWKTFIFGKKRKEWPKKGNKTAADTAEYLRIVQHFTGKKFQTTDEADAYMIYEAYVNKVSIKI